MVLKRVLHALPVLFGVIVVTFLLTRALPGDPAAHFAGASADENSIQEMRVYLGQDKSPPEQFYIYVKNMLQGDLGKSLTTGQTVVSDLSTRLPASLDLTLLGLLISVLISVPLGILAATNPGRWIDHVCRFLVTAGVSLPTFFTGIALIYVFYYLLGIAPPPNGRLGMEFLPPEPVTGFFTIDAFLSGDMETAFAALYQLILPALTLALFTLAPITRMTRAAMIQALSSDFVRTARAAGLSSWKVLITYALRNAMLPVITTMGMVFSFALGANVLVEKVFAWPGIGSYAVNALVASDYAAVQGFVLSMAILFVLLNLLVDIIYTMIDPRIKLEG